MRVLFLNYEFPPIGGGGANATKYLLREFSSIANLEIDLVTSSWDKPGVEDFSSRIRLHKLEVHKKRLHFWTHREIIEYLFKGFFYSKSLVRKIKPHICHAFFGFPSGLIALWLRDGLPYIVSLRGSDVPGFNNRFSAEYVFLAPLFKRIWNCSHRVIANSEGLKYLALKTTPEQHIQIIFNGIDTDEFKPPQEKLNEYPDHINLIAVSRLIERKGIDYLIKALPEILKKDKRVRLTIIGEGNLEDDLKLLAKRLDISDKVSFVGFQDHNLMPEHYNNAHLFVLPSKNEGMSNTILEAMACGLPIITTNTGGTSELIKENGFIVPMEDVSAISSAVLEALADKKLMEIMRKRSRNIALEFSWKKQALKYFNIYKEVTGEA